jgi:hypothetical protein
MLVFKGMIIIFIILSGCKIGQSRISTPVFKNSSRFLLGYITHVGQNLETVLFHMQMYLLRPGAFVHDHLITQTGHCISSNLCPQY